MSQKTYQIPNLPPFESENAFYLTCQTNRLQKALAQFELFKLSCGVAGDIVECGVFKGASFSRFAMFSDITHCHQHKKLIGFDSFGAFPTSSLPQDKEFIKNFTTEAGENSISDQDLKSALHSKNIKTPFALIKGDINQTVPQFCQDNPHTQISLLNVDVDTFDATATILQHLFPMVAKGGIVIFDNYHVADGERLAVDQYLKQKSAQIKNWSFADSPKYYIKE